MNPTKILGILLIAAGTLGLIYGGFTYTKATHSTQVGPIVLQVKDRETVIVPVLVSAAAVALGAILLLASFRGK
jgi:hypothetical protein